RSAEQVEADVRAGLAESVRAGVTLLADVSAGGVNWPLLADAPLRAVVFRELLGLPADRADRAAAEAHAWLSQHPPTATRRPRLSPHAPYSVRADLMARAATMPSHHASPLSVHL